MGLGIMGSQRSAPSRDPPLAARVELLHESERTRVARLVFDVGTVVRKEPLGADAQRRLRHEVEILEHLSGVEGVVQVAAGVPGPPATSARRRTRSTSHSARPRRGRARGTGH